MALKVEILDIIRGPSDDGRRLNSLADQFRRGRDVGDVIPLLHSRNPELVSIGAWILSELPFELYNAPTFIIQLRRLIEHEAPAVRFHAFGALYPALDGKDVATQNLLTKLLADPNDGVRRSAEAAVARLIPK